MVVYKHFHYNTYIHIYEIFMRIGNMSQWFMVDTVTWNSKRCKLKQRLWVPLNWWSILIKSEYLNIFFYLARSGRSDIWYKSFCSSLTKSEQFRSEEEITAVHIQNNYSVDLIIKLFNICLIRFLTVSQNALRHISNGIGFIAGPPISSPAVIKVLRK